MINSQIKSFDGKAIRLTEWADAERPIGIIQISHGMAEHAMRYDGFAKQMNARGYIVIADDHRGHGKTDEDTPGYCDGDIWSATLKDLAVITDYAKKKYGLPVVLFGHSYGSFLTQAYIEKYSNKIVGAVIGGSNYFKDITVPMGRLIAYLGMKIKGAEKPAVLLKKMSFDAYNKKFSSGTFISSIPSECERYEKDKFCNFICSYNFYHKFFKGVSKLYSRESAKGLNTNMPIMLISGKSDPVGNMGKGVDKLYSWYKEHKMRVVKILYEGVRHEYLNDMSRNKAYNDISGFAKEAIEVAASK